MADDRDAVIDAQYEAGKRWIEDRFRELAVDFERDTGKKIKFLGWRQTDPRGVIRFTVTGNPDVQFVPERGEFWLIGDCGNDDHSSDVPRRDNINLIIYN